MTYFQAKQENHEHRYFLDSETRDLVCLCGKLKGETLEKTKSQEGNKYHARKSNYQGYVYDSQKEANHAAELDLLLKAGKILKWERQYPLEVAPEGKHLFTTKVDFRVELPDHSFELHEIKSFITARRPDYRLKRKCIELYWLPKHLDHIYVELQ